MRADSTPAGKFGQTCGLNATRSFSIFAFRISAFARDTETGATLKYLDLPLLFAGSGDRPTVIASSMNTL
jgi:hypothetical protein